MRALPIGPARFRALLRYLRFLVSSHGRSLYQLHLGGLDQIGWTRSRSSMDAVDATGPVPWVTYGALEFLDQVVPIGASVLEVGGGNSTTWWVNRGSTVVSLESDPGWAKRIAGAGIEVEQVDSAETVARVLRARHEAEQVFEVVVVDGIEPRTMYLLEASRLVADGGFLVVDNSDRESYREALEHLSGFDRIDFFGLGPINTYAWCTSVFVRGGFTVQGRKRPIEARAIRY